MLRIRRELHVRMRQDARPRFGPWVAAIILPALCLVLIFVLTTCSTPSASRGYTELPIVQPGGQSQESQPHEGIAEPSEPAQPSVHEFLPEGYWMGKRLDLSDQEWRERLTRTQYRITRRGGTETPYTNRFYDFKGEGTYLCVCCRNPLFSSQAKYDSGTGWPSFFEPLFAGAVLEIEDHSHGVRRTEVLCRGCDGHLGHVFNDGPPPTGRRYCINSAALRFKPYEAKAGVDESHDSKDSPRS